MKKIWDSNMWLDTIEIFNSDDYDETAVLDYIYSYVFCFKCQSLEFPETKPIYDLAINSFRKFNFMPRTNEITMTRDYDSCWDVDFYFLASSINNKNTDEELKLIKLQFIEEFHNLSKKVKNNDQ